MNWDVFLDADRVVQIHWASATIAFFIGGYILLSKKGTTRHRSLGWIYAVLMLLTAFSAIFVRQTAQNGGMHFMGFSFIHLFVPITLVGLAFAIYAIKRGDIRGHKFSNIVTFLGALVIAGAFTFIPGRHVYQFFFGG